MNLRLRFLEKQLAPVAGRFRNIAAITLAKALAPSGRQLTEKDFRAMVDRMEVLSSEGKSFEYIERISKLPIHKFTDYQSYINAGSSRVWATFRACHLVGNVLAGVKMKLTDTRKKNAEVTGTPLNVLLQHPNPHESWEEMIYQLCFHLKLTGNGYWFKDQMNAYGQPLAVFPLLPQHVQPIPDAQTKVAGYIYKINGREKQYGLDEVIHFRRPNPNDTIMGIGDVEPAEALFNQFINRDTYLEKFMENGAQPSGILIKEEAVEDPSEWLKIKSWWDSSYGGKKNIGKTAFLNGKWKYEQLGLDMAKMQNVEAAKENLEQIFMNHGVPLSVAGVKEAANYATARQDDVNFRNYECQPLMDLIVGKLNGQDTDGGPGLIQAFAPWYRLDYELTGLINVEQRAKDYQLAVQYGAMSPNEYREALGLQKIENPFLDQYFVDNTRMPIDMAGLALPQQSDEEFPQGGAPKPTTPAARKPPAKPPVKP